jgi:two-component system, NarL family, nitrate/nitrite response regulator NarL
MGISLVLVDDHPLVLNGLQQLLHLEPDFVVLATCGSADDGLKAVESLDPDVLVLDLKLRNETGLDVLRRLDPSRRPAVVVLTASQDEDELLDAARLGARGIVLKAMAPRVLEDCIRTVHAGGQLLNVDGVDLSKRLAERQTVETELGRSLTPRELEIVRLVAAHLDNQEIAERLSITVGTVKIHLHHIYDKLQLRGRHELQLYLRSRQY